jgi:hypothetical protein
MGQRPLGSERARAAAARLFIVRTADDREEFPVGSFLRAALAAFVPDEGR